MSPYIIYSLCCSWLHRHSQSLFVTTATLNHPSDEQRTLFALGKAMKSGCPGCPVCPTLALMMVGLGSKIPCIFLKAGMTKRLQVTTADTGFPRTDGGTERGGRGEKARGGKYVSNISAQTAEWITLSLNFTHYLGGQRLVCEHRLCPTWQMLLGDWKKRQKQT